MKLNIDIISQSKPEWIETVMSNFNSFLQDHADCERKASAMALSFVAKYPDRIEIIPELIETAVEELEHFQSVYKIMEQREIRLSHSIGEDFYVKSLIKRCHSGRIERFMDRLLIASVVETRGAERFKIVAEHVADPQLKKFYKMLWTSEAKHGHIFVKMALNYFDKNKIYTRLKWWVEQEAEILDSLELRPALH